MELWRVGGYNARRVHTEHGTSTNRREEEASEPESEKCEYTATYTHQRHNILPEVRHTYNEGKSHNEKASGRRAGWNKANMCGEAVVVVQW